MIDIAAFEARLRQRKAELERRLGQIEHDLDETPNPDAEERATEREGDEVLEDLGLAGLEELRAIEAALARIADGSYGDCVKCGKAIAPARLELLPHAPLCANCA